MLKISDIRSQLIRGIRVATNKPAIVAEQAGNKPVYPYTAMKFTVLGDKVGQRAAFMRGTKQVHEQDIELVLSVSCYDKTIDGASDLAYATLTYFDVSGVLALQEQHIVIVNTGPLEDRTTFLTTDWEYRVGFDVQLRVRAQVIQDADYIDTATINIDLD